MASDNFTKVANVNECPPGQMIAVLDGNGAELVLANVDGKYFAISNICSHEWAFLSEGWLKAETLEVICPMHDGHFDLRTGEATALPAEESIPAYNVKVEGDEILVAPA